MVAQKAAQPQPRKQKPRLGVRRPSTRDLTIETIKVSKNALYLESDAQNFCSSPSKTILRMKKQGKQIRIQFDNYMS